MRPENMSELWYKSKMSVFVFLVGFMLIWLHSVFSRQLLLFVQIDFWESKVSHRFHWVCYLVPCKVKFKRDYGEICQANWSRPFAFLPSKVSCRKKELLYSTFCLRYSVRPELSLVSWVYIVFPNSSGVIFYARVEISYTSFSLKGYLKVKE